MSKHMDILASKEAPAAVCGEKKHVYAAGPDCGLDCDYDCKNCRFNDIHFKKERT